MVWKICRGNFLVPDSFARSQNQCILVSEYRTFVHNTGQQIHSTICSLKLTEIWSSNYNESCSIRTFIIACLLCLKKWGSWPENSIIKHWFIILSFCPVLRIFCNRESEEKITLTANTHDLKQFIFLIHCLLRSHYIQNILSSLSTKKCYYFMNFTPFSLIFGQNVWYSRLSGSQESPLPS